MTPTDSNLADQLALASAELASLKLSKFDTETAWLLGSYLRDRGISEGMPIAIDIRSGETPLFSVMLEGAAAANFDWARRKRNLTLLLGKSSWEISLETRLGVDYLASMGLGLRDHAPHGGCIPIFVSGSSVPVATVTISGLPQQQDHELALAGLKHIKRLQSNTASA